ncbi:MAG: hypothetical protein KF768_13890 [Phycisphaeraceae bacterium]|nr:hypothetical protein [Phycisphaeraceae bacterium]
MGTLRVLRGALGRLVFDGDETTGFRLYQYDLFGRLVQVRSLGQITNPTLNPATPARPHAHANEATLARTRTPRQSANSRRGHHAHADRPQRDERPAGSCAASRAASASA